MPTTDSGVVPYSSSYTPDATDQSCMFLSTAFKGAELI